MKPPGSLVFEEEHIILKTKETFLGALLEFYLELYDEDEDLWQGFDPDDPTEGQALSVYGKLPKHSIDTVDWILENLEQRTAAVEAAIVEYYRSKVVPYLEHSEVIASDSEALSSCSIRCVEPPTALGEFGLYFDTTWEKEHDMRVVFRNFEVVGACSGGACL